MKNFILTTLCLMSISAFGQFSSSIDCAGGVDFGYRKIYENKSDVPDILLKNRDQERIGIRANFGFNYNRQVSSSLFFKTGLRFANKGYNSPKFDGKFKWGSQGTNGVYNPELPSNEIIISGNDYLSYNYFFIEVPIEVRYEFKQKNKLSFYVEGGLAPSYYVSSVTIQKFESGNDNFKHHDDAINDFQLGAILAAGVNYQLNVKTQLFLQPTFNYQLTDLVSAPVNEHLYSAGLEIGCRHRIK